MKKIKNAYGIRTVKHMHNTEDARVKAGSEPNQVPERKGVKWLKKVAKFAAKVGLQRFFVWVLEDPDSAWDCLCSNVEMILGVFTP